MCCDSGLNGRITVVFQRTLVLLIVQNTSDLRINVAYAVKYAFLEICNLL